MGPATNRDLDSDSDSDTAHALPCWAWSASCQTFGCQLDAEKKNINKRKIRAEMTIEYCNKNKITQIFVEEKSPLLFRLLCLQ